MEINITKEYTIELLKHYNDILQNDIARVVNNRLKRTNNHDEFSVIISTADLICKTVRDRTEDLIKVIERDI